MEKPFQGQCLCGSIKYIIQSKPKAVGCCYCKSCQVKSGSDHIVYLACEAGSVAIDGSVKWYQSIGDSELPKQHGFCSDCGSTLFGKPQVWPNLLIVYAGSLDDTSTYPPQTNLWLQDAPEWACIDTNLAAFDKNPD
jgi:hypothetical protein